MLAALALLASAATATPAGASGGAVATLAGSSPVGFADGPVATAQFSSAMGGLALSGATIFVADAGNNRIRRVDSGQVTTLAGDGTVGTTDGVSPRFGYPFAVAVDPTDGSLVVADLHNGAVRRVSLSGAASTLLTGLSSPHGVAVAADGTIFASDTGAHRIWRIPTSGPAAVYAGTGTPGASDGAAGSATFNNPRGLAIAPDGSLYVADSASARIRRISVGAIVSTVAGSSSGAADGPASSAQFNYPYGVFVTVTNEVLVADTFNNRVRMLTSANDVITVAGTTSGLADGAPSAAAFNLPTAVAMDSSGTVYVADHSNGRIRTVTMTACSVQDSPCSTTGQNVVRYGAAGRYVHRVLTGSFNCDNATFGDPIPGTAKQCWTSEDPTAPPPPPTTTTTTTTTTAPTTTTTTTTTAPSTTTTTTAPTTTTVAPVSTTTTFSTTSTIVAPTTATTATVPPTPTTTTTAPVTSTTTTRPPAPTLPVTVPAKLALQDQVPVTPVADIPAPIQPGVVVPSPALAAASVSFDAKMAAAVKATNAASVATVAKAAAVAKATKAINAAKAAKAAAAAAVKALKAAQNRRPLNIQKVLAARQAVLDTAKAGGKTKAAALKAVAAAKSATSKAALATSKAKAATNAAAAADKALRAKLAKEPAVKAARAAQLAKTATAASTAASKTAAAKTAQATKAVGVAKAAAAKAVSAKDAAAKVTAKAAKVKANADDLRALVKQTARFSTGTPPGLKKRLAAAEAEEAKAAKAGAGATAKAAAASKRALSTNKAATTTLKSAKVAATTSVAKAEAAKAAEAVAAQAGATLRGLKTALAVR